MVRTLPPRRAAVPSTKAKRTGTARRAPTDLSPQSSDLDILLPERELEIGGEKITVRELNFGEQLKHGKPLALLTDALALALDAPDEEAGLSAVMDALAAHADALLPLVALCVGKPEEWIANLPGEAGEALLIAWWSANQGFFMRRLMRALIVRVAAAGRAGETGGASSLPSSGTGTGNAS